MTLATLWAVDRLNASLPAMLTAPPDPSDPRLGNLQLGVGALISTGISLSTSKSTLPIIVILTVTSLTGLVLLLFGKKAARNCSVTD